MNNYEIRIMDCSEKKVVLVRGVQAKHVRLNPTASHLKAEFVLPGVLDDGDELHIFTTNDEKDVTNVAKVIQKMGFDFSKAVVATLN
jgi:translation initiation factor 1 (eIF-1/SUI1)